MLNIKIDKKRDKNLWVKIYLKSFMVKEILVYICMYISCMYISFIVLKVIMIFR